MRRVGVLLAKHRRVAADPLVLQPHEPREQLRASHPDTHAVQREHVLTEQLCTSTRQGGGRERRSRRVISKPEQLAQTGRKEGEGAGRERFPAISSITATATAIKIIISSSSRP